MRQLQGVLNAAARLIVCKKKYDSITSTRPELVADSTTRRLQARCTHVQLPAQLGTRLLDYHVSRSIGESWSSQSTLSRASGPYGLTNQNSPLRSP